MADKALSGEKRIERRAYWSTQLERSHKRYRNFLTDGDRVIDEYRSQKPDGNSKYSRDKYNILYSSTETIRPNLYAKLPTVRVKLRHVDTAGQAARDGAELLGSSLQYVIEEEDFDDVMDNVVEDVLLPGLGQGWVRYDPTFAPAPANAAPAPPEAGGETKPPPGEVLMDEQVRLDYLYWADFRTGTGRTWKTVPWVAKRAFMTKEAVSKRFDPEKAALVTYGAREKHGRDTESDTHEDTAEIWEIWDKRSKTVFWYCDSYVADLLDVQQDPLRLKNFFPCPRPVRAISNTRTFVPLSLYSQYKAQAEQINELTRKIRLLTEALKVVGLFDGSNPKLSDILNAASGNKMIPVEGWAAFKGDGGIKGSIEWLPLIDVVTTLTQLLQAREVCKAEIYEITGFSDILRGVSKASETLGAQNIKANWGGARLKRMQKEIQRFARDMIAIAGEIISEHCRPSSIAMFGGVQLPDEATMANNPAAQDAFKRFTDAVQLLRDDGKRLAAVDIETDSTILADETAERADRTAFLAAAGAFLQQAVPAAQANPKLAGLLGALLMFTVRTFPSSRPIEDQFEALQKSMAEEPPKQDDNGEAAKAQAAQQTAQLQAQTEAARLASEERTAQATLVAKQQSDAAQLQQEALKEQNRHDEKLMELGIKQRELEIREREVAVKEAEAAAKARAQQEAQELDEAVAATNARQEDEALALDADRVTQEAERTAQEALTPEGE